MTSGKWPLRPALAQWQPALSNTAFPLDCPTWSHKPKYIVVWTRQKRGLICTGLAFTLAEQLPPVYLFPPQSTTVKQSPIVFSLTALVPMSCLNKLEGLRIDRVMVIKSWRTRRLGENPAFLLIFYQFLADRFKDSDYTSSFVNSILEVTSWTVSARKSLADDR